MTLLEEIHKRRTFAIISHPDAGKTTITEKLLLFGGAIQQAGAIKAKKTAKFTTSDWMELEKQRGVSVATSVMCFEYKDMIVNILDTPGHADFSEDTYRTLTAVDSVLMVAQSQLAGRRLRGWLTRKTAERTAGTAVSMSAPSLVDHLGIADFHAGDAWRSSSSRVATFTA